MSSELAAARVARAAHIPALLDAAYAAFEYMLASLRAAEDQAGALLPAFVMAAAAAASGRDAVGGAPSLPPADPAAPRLAITAGDPGSLADSLAELSLILSEHLAAVVTPADRSACESAAGYARRIHGLLAATPR